MPPVVRINIRPMQATSGTAACLITVKMLRTAKKFFTNTEASTKRIRNMRMLP